MCRTLSKLVYVLHVVATSRVGAMTAMRKLRSGDGDPTNDPYLER